jgi:transcriptional regulator of NAD metabolism
VESKERRELLMEKLKANAAPVTGAALAQAFGVSRQVVVGDIAILRAAGVDILATPKGI